MNQSFSRLLRILSQYHSPQRQNTTQVTFRLNRNRRYIVHSIMTFRNHSIRQHSNNITQNYSTPRTQLQPNSFNQLPDRLYQSQLQRDSSIQELNSTNTSVKCLNHYSKVTCKYHKFTIKFLIWLDHLLHLTATALQCTLNTKRDSYYINLWLNITSSTQTSIPHGAY